MKILLPRRYTLDQLLGADPISQLYGGQYQEALKAHRDSCPLDRDAEIEVMKRLNDATEKDPDLSEEINKCDTKTPKGIGRLAKLIDVSRELLMRMSRFQNNGPDATLIRSWRALKHSAGIKDIGENNFPKTFEQPMLVLYSADWCPPCRVIRPTFARLVPFFDKAEVRYCHEDEWRREQGVDYIPQFVAYFPGGSRVKSSTGRTTKKIWETMNALFTLGKSWEGEGELMCDENTCIVVPIKNQ